jgi:hypothetical protein
VALSRVGLTPIAVTDSRPRLCTLKMWVTEGRQCKLSLFDCGRVSDWNTTILDDVSRSRIRASVRPSYSWSPSEARVPLEMASHNGTKFVRRPHFCSKRLNVNLCSTSTLSRCPGVVHLILIRASPRRTNLFAGLYKLVPCIRRGVQ